LHKATLWGVEDPELYHQALESYRLIHKHREELDHYLNRIESTLKVLQNKIYNPSLQKILDAPVGTVENTIREALNCEVHIDIIEQHQESGSNFVRKIMITAKDFPVVRATVNFNSDVIPEKILEELLRKKEGIGTILTRNNIKPERKIISINSENDNKKVIQATWAANNSRRLVLHLAELSVLGVNQSGLFAQFLSGDVVL